MVYLKGISDSYCSFFPEYICRDWGSSRAEVRRRIQIADWCKTRTRTKNGGPRVPNKTSTTYIQVAGPGADSTEGQDETVQRASREEVMVAHKQFRRPATREAVAARKQFRRPATRKAVAATEVRRPATRKARTGWRHASGSTRQG